MIMVRDVNGNQHDWSKRNSAYYVEPYNGQVRVSDNQGVYLLAQNEAEEALAQEPPQEPERPHYNTGVRQRELFNAQTKIENEEGWDPWWPGRTRAPSPFRDIEMSFRNRAGECARRGPCNIGE